MASTVEILNRKKQEVELLRNNLTPEQEKKIDSALKKIEEKIRLRQNVQNAEIQHLQEIIESLQQPVMKEMELVVLIAEKLHSDPKINELKLENLKDIFPDFWKTLNPQNQAEIEKDWPAIWKLAREATATAREYDSASNKEKSKTTLSRFAKEHPVAAWTIGIAVAAGATLFIYHQLKNIFGKEKTWSERIGGTVKGALGIMVLAAGMSNENVREFIKKLTSLNIPKKWLPESLQKYNPLNFGEVPKPIHKGPTEQGSALDFFTAEELAQVGTWKYQTIIDGSWKGAMSGATANVFSGPASLLNINTEGYMKMERLRILLDRNKATIEKAIQIDPTTTLNDVLKTIKDKNLKLDGLTIDEKKSFDERQAELTPEQQEDLKIKIEQAITVLTAIADHPNPENFVDSFKSIGEVVIDGAEGMAYFYIPIVGAGVQAVRVVLPKSLAIVEGMQAALNKKWDDLEKRITNGETVETSKLLELTKLYSDIYLDHGGKYLVAAGAAAGAAKGGIKGSWMMIQGTGLTETKIVVPGEAGGAAMTKTVHKFSLKRIGKGALRITATPLDALVGGARGAVAPFYELPKNTLKGLSIANHGGEIVRAFRARTQLRALNISESIYGKPARWIKTAGGLRKQTKYIEEIKIAIRRTELLKTIYQESIGWMDTKKIEEILTKHESTHKQAAAKISQISDEKIKARLSKELAEAKDFTTKNSKPTKNSKTTPSPIKTETPPKPKNPKVIDLAEEKARRAPKTQTQLRPTQQIKVEPQPEPIKKPHLEVVKKPKLEIDPKTETILTEKLKVPRSKIQVLRSVLKKAVGAVVALSILEDIANSPNPEKTIIQQSIYLTAFSAAFNVASKTPVPPYVKLLLGMGAGIGTIILGKEGFDAASEWTFDKLNDASKFYFETDIRAIGNAKSNTARHALGDALSVIDPFNNVIDPLAEKIPGLDKLAKGHNALTYFGETAHRAKYSIAGSTEQYFQHDRQDVASWNQYLEKEIQSSKNDTTKWEGKIKYLEETKVKYKNFKGAFKRDLEMFDSTIRVLETQIKQAKTKAVLLEREIIDEKWTKLQRGETFGDIVKIKLARQSLEMTDLKKILVETDIALANHLDPLGQERVSTTLKKMSSKKIDVFNFYVATKKKLIEKLDIYTNMGKFSEIFAGKKKILKELLPDYAQPTK